MPIISIVLGLIVIMFVFLFFVLYSKNRKYMESGIDISSLLADGYEEAFDEKRYFYESKFRSFFLSNNFSKVYRKFEKRDGGKKTYIFFLSLKVTSREACGFNAVCYLKDCGDQSPQSLVVSSFENKIYFANSKSFRASAPELKEGYQIIGEDEKNWIGSELVNILNKYYPAYFEVRDKKLLFCVPFKKFGELGFLKMVADIEKN